MRYKQPFYFLRASMRRETIKYAIQRRNRPVEKSLASKLNTAAIANNRMI